ncbi:DUF2971 domain-containing protein [Aliarcobacter butzleri]|uniref:DUF2971 domain-containing protein n=1 Tax=Aliarcobacter butzleri TaxID=28197 RepID=UPI001EDC34E7|nr:DUF2971 domain-containing protein [Aliarcobacter butzleri]MCG3685357.1 DUF2971 domain-containing protein [Aliarcobacter butzleri]
MNTSNELKDDRKIWRYMNFTKFISMLSHNALHFSRADLFTDKWEGAVPDLIFQKLKDKLSADDTENTKTFIEKLKTLTNINCWHINEFESAAMWDLYGTSDGTIAIESDFKTLNEIFSKINKSSTSSIKFEINSVKYIDYNIIDNIGLNASNIFFYKRKSFEHEKELRIIRQDRGNIDIIRSLQIFDYPPNEKTLIQPINLLELIKIIHVSPAAPEWFFELVKKVVQEDYKLNIKVKQSILYKNPIY